MSEGNQGPTIDGHEFIETICSALRAGKRLKVVDRRGKIYGKDDFRLVEVHAVGFAHGGFAAARVWEIANFEIAHTESRWELLHLSNVAECKMIDERSRAPRPGYRRDDPGMKEILCQI